MTPVRQVWALIFFATAIHAAPAAAQATRSMTEDGPREAVAERAAPLEKDQAALRAYQRLMRFGTLYEDMGLDLQRTETATAFRHLWEVGPLASHAPKVEGARIDLDDKIVIPTTAVIIGLLVLIVILVAD